jgi:hypothetical protein
VAATPLFTGAARRRDTLKLVLAGEAGVTSEGGRTGAAGAGVRLGDFIEVTARVRALGYAAPAATSAPLRLLYGARFAFHLDGDGDRRSAFVLGGELLSGTAPDGASLVQGSLIVGPRFGITERTFASLLVAPSFLSASNRPTAGQVTVSLEFGFDL